MPAATAFARWFAWTLIAALAVGAGVACGDDDAASGPQAITVKVVEPYTFDPEVITLEKGRPARVTLDNTEGAEAHDFAIRDMAIEEGGVTVTDAEHSELFAVYVYAEQGESKTTVEFVPSEEGDFYFFCNIPGHIQGGMIGAVRVR